MAPWLGLAGLLTLLIALGCTLTRHLPGTGLLGLLERIALGAGLGIGISALLQFLVLPIGNGAPWPLEVVVAGALLGLVCRRAACRRDSRAADGGELTPPPGQVRPFGLPPRLAGVLAIALAVACLLVLVQHGRAFLGLTLAQPHGEWDAKAIWNLKARFLFRAGADWHMVTDPGLVHSHPDYPWLLPLALLRGFHALGHESAGYTQALAGGFLALTFTALVLGLRQVAGGIAGWLGGLLLLSGTYWTTQGAAQQADVPLGFFVLAMLRSLAAATPGRRAPLLLAGCAGSLCAFTKNEGALWAACAVLAALLTRFADRGIRGGGHAALWLAIGALPGILALVWFKLTIAGRNDLASLSTTQEVVQRLLDPQRYRQVLAAVWSSGLQLAPLGLATAPLVALLSGASWRRRSEGTVTPILAVLAMLVVLVLVFVATPVDLTWHLQTSEPRLLVQLWPAWVFAWLAWANGGTPPPH